MPKPTTAHSSLVQATTSFVARVGTEDVPVKAGDLADADADIVRKYPDLFAPLAVRFAHAPRVEAATAAPGEKRGA